jgi:hypothetical protein
MPVEPAEIAKQLAERGVESIASRSDPREPAELKAG